MASKSSQTGFDHRPEDDRSECHPGDNCGESGLPSADADEEMDVEAENADSVDKLGNGPLHPSSMHRVPDALNTESLAFSTYLGSSNENSPWANENIATFYYGGDLTDLEPFGPDYDRSFPQTPTQPMEIQPPTPSSRIKDSQAPDTDIVENTTLMHSRPSKVQISKSPRYAISNRSAHHFDSMRTLDAQGAARDINFNISFARKSATHKDFVENDRPFLKDSLSAKEAQHRRMQELSELRMSLYSQLMANDAHPQAASGPPGLQDQFVGNVLKSSAAFLSLLTSFYPAARSSAKLSVFTPNDGDSSASEAFEFSNFATDERSQRHWKHSIARSGGVSNKDALKPLPTDMTTIFQLLTCYIRIIHLHSILYSKIFDHLTTLPHRKDAQLPPAFPGMQVGCMSLDDFGSFQMKLLLQISTHILGEVEMALGLPDGYRISK